MFKSILHVNAVDILKELYPEETIWDNLIYLREELEVYDNRDYSVKIWSDNAGHIYDSDDNSITAQIGRWIAANLPFTSYICIDFE